MPRPKAILAGATGFLGQAVLKNLAGVYDFHLLKRNPDTGEGDLALPGPLPESPRADVLFHVAGVTSGRGESQDVSRVYRENWNITLSLLDLCRRSNVPKIVFASSYVYGHPKYLPIPETHPVDALTPYMHSKLMCEDLLQAFSRWTGIQAVCLRLFNPYGPDQKKGMLIPDILSQIHQKDISLGDPRPKRDFIHVSDVVEAFHAAAGYVPVGGYDVFNIGSGESYSVQQVARWILKFAGSSAALHFRPQRTVDVQEVVADISKARSILGWGPRIPFEKGLQQMVEDVTRNRQAVTR